MELKKEIGERIKLARNNNKLTRKHLSELTGFTSSRIANWECGIRTPNWDSAKTLGKILGVNPTYLLCFDLKANKEEHCPNDTKGFYSSIPLFSLSSLETEADTKENIPIPNFLISTVTKETIAIRQEDDSMQPLINNGDVVTFEKNTIPIHGDIVLVEFINSEKFHIRKIQFDNSDLNSEKIIFSTLNQDWPDTTITLSSQYKVIAVMRTNKRLFL